MLGTLFKYDFLALGRTLGIVQLCVFVAGLFGSFLVGIGYRSASSQWNSSLYSSNYGAFESVFASVSSMLGGLLFSAVFASSLVTLFLIARYYYKNFFSAEGYLTFTLPLKPGQLLMSKIFAGVLWTLINALVIILVCVALSLFGFTDEIVDTYSLKAYGDLFVEIATPLGALTTVEFVLFIFISSILNVILLYASISVGCSVARTHKVLASVGFYLLMNFILSIIISGILFSAFFAMLDNFSLNSLSNSWFYELNMFMLPIMICVLLSIIILYFVSKNPIKRNLNLD